MLPIIRKSKAQGDYRYIPKVSKQLRNLFEVNDCLRLWVIAFSFSVWNTCTDILFPKIKDIMRTMV